MSMTIIMPDGLPFDATKTYPKGEPMALQRPIPPNFDDQAISSGGLSRDAAEEAATLAAIDAAANAPPPDVGAALAALDVQVTPGAMMADELASRVRMSRLKLFALSPLHYLMNIRGDDTTSLDKGTAVHSVLLKGKRVCYYDGKVKTKKGEPPSDKIGPRNGEQWEAFRAANSDALILSIAEYNATMRMVDAVRGNKLAMSLIQPASGRKIEDTIEFDFLGIKTRTTPDARTRIDCVEIKTCKSARPIDFLWQSRKMLYHAQHAHHRNGMRAKNPAADPAHFTIAVENSGVPAVVVYQMTPAAMAEGDKCIRSWFEQLKVCRESGRFPAYSDAIVDLDIPGLEPMDD